MRLAQGRRAEVGILGILAAAGERDLARVATEVLAPAGQDDRRLAIRIEEQRDEYSRVGAAVDVESRRLDGIEEDAFEQLAQISARA